MLNVMRDNLKHLKWVLWIVAASMLLYLGLYFDSGSGPSNSASWAAKVGGETIGTEEFLEEARREDDRYRQMLGANYEQIARQFRLKEQVIERLIAGRLMLAEARKLGLEATPEEVASQIRNDPSLRDASGQFIGTARYVEVVSRAFAGGVPAYEKRVAESLAVQKWMDLMSQAAAVSDTELERLYRSRNDRAAIDYVFVPAAAQAVDKTATDAMAEAYYAAHRDNYRRGEGRRVKTVVVARQAAAVRSQVGDADVRAFYDQNVAEFSRPEQRRARHILLKTESGSSDADRRAVRSLAESVLARVRKGEDFATVAKAMSQDTGSAERGGDLGWFGRGQMVPAFDQAAFTLPTGQISDVVESEFGFHILQVTDSRAAGTAPFDEVKDAIRRQLEVRKSQEWVQTEAQRIRGAIKTAADLDAVAAKEGLQVETRVITREDGGADFGASPDFVTTAFSLPVGEVSQPVAVTRGMAILTVVESVPPAVRPLTEVIEKVRLDLIAARQAEAASTAARRGFASGDLAAAAKALKLDVKQSGDIVAGQGLPGVGSAPQLETALFGPGSAVGRKGVVEIATGAVIYVVTKRDTFDPSKFESGKAALRAEILRQRKDALLQPIVEGLRQKIPVEINTDVVRTET